MLRLGFWVILVLFLSNCGQQQNDSDYENPNFTPSTSANYLNQDQTIHDQPVGTFAITRIALVGTDEDATTPTADDLIHFINHPIKWQLDIQADGEPFETVLYFGLVEKPTVDASNSELSTLKICSLGSHLIAHGGSDQDGQPTISTIGPEFIIPTDCLGDTDLGTFNLMVGIDQLGEVDFTDPTISSGMVSVFNERELNNAFNQSCSGADGRIGCIYDITIKPSPGLNITISEFTNESNIALLRPDALNNESPYVTGDSDEHDTPFLKTDITILLYGADAETDDALDNDKEVSIAYEICPTDINHDDATITCVGDLWQSLTIFDPDKPNTPIGHQSKIALTELRAQEPTHFSHDLYVDEALYNVMTQGIWRNYIYFLVRSCVRPNFSEAILHDQDDARSLPDHCRKTQVKVVQMEAKTTNTGDRALSLSRIWDNTFGSRRNFGARMDISVQTFMDKKFGANFFIRGDLVTTGWFELKLFRLQYTAIATFPDNEGSGSLLKFSLFGVIPIFYASIGATDTSSSSSPKVGDLGENGVLDQIKELFKEHCLPGGIPIPSTPIKLTPCITSAAGFTISMGVLSKKILATESNTTFPNAKSVGAIVGTFTPNANINMSLNLGQSFFGVKLGVTGVASIAAVTLPTGPTIYWGRDKDTEDLSLKLVIQSNLKLSTLSGSFGIQFPIRSIFSGCFMRAQFGFFLPYPCEKQSYSQYLPIAKWTGFSYNLNLMDRTITSLTLQ